MMLLAIIMWPVDDIGKNSVIPSTIAMMIDLIISIQGKGRKKSKSIGSFQYKPTESSQIDFYHAVFY